MQTIREFIEEAVEEYNSGKLTLKRFYAMEEARQEMFRAEFNHKLFHLSKACTMLRDMLIEQKGKKILKKVDFEWEELKRRTNPNPFYEPIDIF